ncbi:MAG: hypothetical protein GTO45_28830 [Candidatus Aminicenantes bacterium]|nr:hypothetical protein [Candidatus Aminicenantes bacterium]NIM82593.1 hypothetical protein [Candidatus Aminicenantes bacterium]NIN22180.1 hypothetical protein [Candidatus Aminicenantes bacterium]NIN45940.1 hypothetical protein [Candidatus Aminicenantes bacterium]NIN88776.1 hypothetical protein [Candidatus Aminicenantes bacterium]
MADEKKIYYDGDVGIGTAEPEGKLDVRGDIWFGKESDPGHKIGKAYPENQHVSCNWIEFGGNGDNYIKLHTHKAGVCTQDTMMLSADGNVGIGTTKPGDKLTLCEGNIRLHKKHAQSNENTWEQEILFTDEVDRKGAKISSKREKWDGAPMSLSFFTGGMDKIREQLTIKSDGNVGIGKTDPAYKLDVAGEIRGSNVAPSDKRFKKDVRPLENALEKAMALRGVNFQWKKEMQGKGPQIGLIAQEVEKVLPEVVSTDNEGYKSLAYDRLAAVLVEAIKEQQTMIQQLQAESEALKELLWAKYPEVKLGQVK